MAKKSFLGDLQIGDRPTGFWAGYVIHDWRGVPVYVGITGYPLRHRFLGHKKNQKWAPWVDFFQRSSWTFADRAAAEEWEAEKIRELETLGYELFNKMKSSSGESLDVFTRVLNACVLAARSEQRVWGEGFERFLDPTKGRAVERKVEMSPWFEVTPEMRLLETHLPIASRNAGSAITVDDTFNLLEMIGDKYIRKGPPDLIEHAGSILEKLPVSDSGWFEGLACLAKRQERNFDIVDVSVEGFVISKLARESVASVWDKLERTTEAPVFCRLGLNEQTKTAALFLRGLEQ